MSNVQRFVPREPLHKVESTPHAELSLDDAKHLVGQIVTKAIDGTATPRKSFGDKSQVGKWCAGTENPNLARLIQRPAVRRELALALIESCEGVEISTEVRFVRRAA